METKNSWNPILFELLRGLSSLSLNWWGSQDDTVFSWNTSGQYFYLSFVFEMLATKSRQSRKKMVEIASCLSYWEVWVHLVWISEVLLYQDDNVFFRNTSGQYFYLSFVTEMPATKSTQTSCQIAVLDWNKFYLHPVLYPWLATNYLENTYFMRFKY